MKVEPWRLVAGDTEGPVAFAFPQGQVVAWARRAPHRAGGNQDGCAVVPLGGDDGVLLVLADGAGGLPAAERAAEVVIDAFLKAFAETKGALRERVLTAIESADQALAALKVGAGSTIAVAHVRADGVRSFHVGDSGVMLVGQRGRRVFESIAHSPVGYAVEAGVLDENEALVHEDRHLVSNMLGGGDARIEMSSRIPMGARDTLLLASDGLFDNLPADAIVDTIRKGPLEGAAEALGTAARARMRASLSTNAAVGKSDDLTFLLLRRPA
ncbi:MAG: PP2C family protein-serine/threonine phosphatase [Planctomycetota bacterium]